jgi:hypothetical protein
VELVGRAEIIDDPDQLWTLGISVFERYYGAYTDELKPFLEIMLHKRVAVKLHVERTVSWDHRKLGAAVDATGRVKFSIGQAVAVSPAPRWRPTATRRSTRAVSAGRHRGARGGQPRSTGDRSC